MVIKQTFSLRLLEIPLYHVPSAVLLQEFLGLLPAVVRGSYQVGEKSIETIDGFLMKMLFSLLVSLSETSCKICFHFLFSFLQTCCNSLLLGLLFISNIISTVMVTSMIISIVLDLLVILAVSSVPLTSAHDLSVLVTAHFSLFPVPFILTFTILASTPVFVLLFLLFFAAISLFLFFASGSTSALLSPPAFTSTSCTSILLLFLFSSVFILQLLDIVFKPILSLTAALDGQISIIFVNKLLN